MLEEVAKALKSGATEAPFCTSFAVPAAGFHVEVGGVGPVTGVITEAIVKRLMKEARLASFGWRDQTVVDTRVRNVWEIPAANITIPAEANRHLCDSTLERIQHSLGLAEEGKLKAELHNVLIYEPGQFFSIHQDSEKCHGMVATMTVLLPSAFQGGDLVIDHQGKKKTFGAPKIVGNELNITAFYADCHHEVKKVKAGYRVALTYNLKFEPQGSTFPSWPNSKLTSQIKRYFAAQEPKTDSDFEIQHPHWLVYLLDHQYSQKGLGWSLLKGIDRDRAAEFRATAGELGLSFHLALAELHETWQTEEEYSYGRRYGRYQYNDESDDEEDNGNDATLVDLIDDDYALAHWIDIEDISENLKPHHVPKPMFCWTKATDEFEPFRTHYEGYMGNYGNTMDRWYHRAALVLWRADDDYSSRFAIDPLGTLKKIKKIVGKDKASGISILEKVLPQWRHLSGSDPKEVTDLLEVAALTDNKKLALNLLSILNLATLCKKNAKPIAALAASYGEEWVLQLLTSWSKSRSYGSESLSDLTHLVQKLSAFKEVVRWLLDFQFKALASINRDLEKQGSRRDIDRRQTDTLKTANEILQAARSVNDADTSNRVVDQVLSHRRVYPALALAELVKELSEGVNQSPAWKKLSSECAKRLVSETAKNRDTMAFSIDDPIPCSCGDCKTLSEFLKSKDGKKTVWPLAKDRRQHIHQIIDGMGIEVSHETQRTGSPHKLILTKLDTHFEKERATKKRMTDFLSWLQQSGVSNGQ